MFEAVDQAVSITPADRTCAHYGSEISQVRANSGLRPVLHRLFHNEAAQRLQSALGFGLLPGVKFARCSEEARHGGPMVDGISVHICVKLLSDHLRPVLTSSHSLRCHRLLSPFTSQEQVAAVGVFLERLKMWHTHTLVICCAVGGG